MSPGGGPLLLSHPANSQAAAAVCAVPKRGALSRVAVPNLDRVVRQAKRVGRDLGEGRLVALAVGV